jgi:hypothetical protein
MDEKRDAKLCSGTEHRREVRMIQVLLTGAATDHCFATIRAMLLKVVSFTAIASSAAP